MDSPATLSIPLGARQVLVRQRKISENAPAPMATEVWAILAKNKFAVIPIREDGKGGAVPYDEVTRFKGICEHRS